MVLSEEEIILKVQKDYNTISEFFSKTREKPWPEFFLFLEWIKNGDRILDLGCGNCRLGAFLKEKGLQIEYWGVDISEMMLKECSKKMPEAKTYLTLSSNLPFSSEFFDLVASIALVHHLPPQELQKTIQETLRVLKKGGVAFFVAWNLWRKEFWKEHLKSILGFLLRKNRFKELFIPFTDPEKKIRVERYARAVTLGELRKSFLKEGFIIEKALKTNNQRNLCLIARKP